MSGLKVPIISVVIGEGASGGALGIGVCDVMIMMENTWYSVISPEGVHLYFSEMQTVLRMLQKLLNQFPLILLKWESVMK